MRTLLSTLMAIIILICGCIYFSGCTPAKNPPVIASFNAGPASINPGGSSTLSWTVNGARSVSLDNGIGTVGVKGTRAVTPTATTVYVLTATNAAGDTTASTQITVAGTSASTGTTLSSTGIPAINSFSVSPGNIPAGSSSTLSWNVSNATSVNIQPGIGNVANIGSTAVAPGISTQYILTATNSSGSNQASTQIIVTSGTAGPSGTTGTSSSTAGTSGTTGTSSSGTSTTTTTPLQIGPILAAPFTSPQYDFITHAPGATWQSTDGPLDFPKTGTTTGPCASVHETTMMEDGKVYRALSMYPPKEREGSIRAYYWALGESFELKSGDRFYSKIGFQKDNFYANVKFIVWVQIHGTEDHTKIADISKTYDGTLTTIDLPLKPYEGKNIDVQLQVTTNHIGDYRDAAFWIQPRIIR